MKVSVIGTGYVGLVTGAGLSDFGNNVTCVDTIKSKIKLLNNGSIPIYEPGLKDLIKHNMLEQRLSFTIDIKKAIKNSEVIFIAVGTPELQNGDADLSFIETVAEKILSQEKPVTVIDSNNKVVGIVKPSKIIHTVFGGRKNNS